MKINELREYQLDFEPKRVELQKWYKEINFKREKFITDYPINTIKKLKIDEYIAGKGGKTFCNRIENELNDWGNIHGATAKKFGVYYGTFGEGTKKEYRFSEKFGNNIDEAFVNLKIEIVNLIKNAENENIEKIRESKISPMFKGKIISLYFPEKYLNIFSAKYLNYFINHLSLKANPKYEIDKQKLLLDYKNSDKIMQNWTVFEFNSFLYHTFGNPRNEKDEELLHPDLKTLITKELPDIERVKSEFVELNIVEYLENKEKDKTIKRKVDFEQHNKANKRLGDRGEIIVLKAEEQRLIKLGKSNLINQIKHVSLSDDTLGYDIVSFEKNDEKRYIEVKSTRQKVGNVSFLISANEMDKALTLDNFYIYIVFEADSIYPKIWKIKGNKALNEKLVSIEPISYRIKINAK